LPPTTDGIADATDRGNEGIRPEFEGNRDGIRDVIDRGSDA